MSAFLHGLVRRASECWSINAHWFLDRTRFITLMSSVWSVRIVKVKRVLTAGRFKDKNVASLMHHF